MLRLCLSINPAIIIYLFLLSFHPRCYTSRTLFFSHGIILGSRFHLPGTSDTQFLSICFSLYYFLCFTVFYCMNIHIIKPVFCWWTLNLFIIFCYYKYISMNDIINTYFYMCGHGINAICKIMPKNWVAKSIQVILIVIIILISCNLELLNHNKKWEIKRQYYKFYLSMTSIEVNKKKKSVEIIMNNYMLTNFKT